MSGSRSSMPVSLPHPGETPLAVGISQMHPGVFFMEKYLRPRGLEVDVAAAKMLLSPDVLNDIIAQRRRVDDDIAARLGEFTKTSPRVWLNMQSAADYADAHKG